MVSSLYYFTLLKLPSTVIWGQEMVDGYLGWRKLNDH